MSDDSFIREVDEELRSDRMQAIWDRYGRIIIGIAVLIVVATAGYRGWLYYSKTQAASSGDRFIEAIELSKEGKHEEAIAKLGELQNDGSGQYPFLARLRLASELAEKGELENAIAAFDEIAADPSTDETLKDVAKLRAGLLMVDTGEPDEVRSRLEPLSKAGDPFRHLAREGLGLLAWREAEFEKAYEHFKAISEDAGAPAGVRGRAGLMLELLAGKGITSGKS